MLYTPYYLKLNQWNMINSIMILLFLKKRNYYFTKPEKCIIIILDMNKSWTFILKPFQNPSVSKNLPLIVRKNNKNSLNDSNTYLFM
jgi:hypothetical protein